jgi:hypothetical protein
MLRAWSYTETTECEKEPANDGLEKLNTDGRREVRLCDEAAFERCQSVTETYNRSRVRS